MLVHHKNQHNKQFNVGRLKNTIAQTIQCWLVIESNITNNSILVTHKSQHNHISMNAKVRTRWQKRCITLGESMTAIGLLLHAMGLFFGLLFYNYTCYFGSLNKNLNKLARYKCCAVNTVPCLVSTLCMLSCFYFFSNFAKKHCFHPKLFWSRMMSPRELYSIIKRIGMLHFTSLIARV